MTTQADHESQVSDAAFEASIGAHTTSVTRVRRVDPIARHVWRVRCVSCKYAREYPEADVVRARREALRHETNGAAS